MRTSRISRETAKVVEALSPSKRPNDALRRSLRKFTASDSAQDHHGIVPEEAAESPIKDSSHQESLQIDVHSSLGKRKRGNQDPTAKGGTNLVALEQSTYRRSPRKASGHQHEGSESGSAASSSRSKAKRQPAKRITGPNGAVQVQAPLNWQDIYSTTTAMRKRLLAPVDTMGCESLAEEHRSPKDKRLQTLVSLMLSSQTKDTVTAAAMRNLQSNMVGGFCLESLLKTDESELNRLIEKVGFHNTKAKHIKRTASILEEQFAGDIPDTIEGLVSLPGVGPKMAYLCMSAAWGRDEGIGVDVHVHRITNLWGWHKTSTPEQTREMLESWLPKDKWHDINHLLVGLGQTICLPVGRRCNECDLSKEKLCPSANPSSPVKRRVKRVTEIDANTGSLSKEEEVVVEADHVGVKVEADLQGVGSVEVQGIAGGNGIMVRDVEQIVKYDAQ